MRIALEIITLVNIMYASTISLMLTSGSKVRRLAIGALRFGGPRYQESRTLGLSEEYKYLSGFEVRA